MTHGTNNRETFLKQINHKYMKIVCLQDSLYLW